MTERAPTSIHEVVGRNIQALVDVRRRFDAQRTPQERVAGAITRFAGSMRFVYLHAAVVGLWIVVNARLVPWIPAFDPFPFVMLAMAASVEAIFLSTFVLLTQNRMSELADRRPDLDLQINLLAEHEITRLIELTDAIAKHLGVEQKPAGTEELKHDIAPERVLDEIEKAESERPK